jgi:hypothetical protein
MDLMSSTFPDYRDSRCHSLNSKFFDIEFKLMINSTLLKHLSTNSKCQTAQVPTAKAAVTLSSTFIAPPFSPIPFLEKGEIEI